jgi:hypothetical protein
MVSVAGIPSCQSLDHLNFIAMFYMKSSQLRLFADDSIIYKTIKSQKDCDSLQEDLDAAARWESDWLMAFLSFGLGSI